MTKRMAFLAAWLFLAFFLILNQISTAQAGQIFQIPTGTVLTVTGTPSGPIVTVRLDLDQPSINVRAGPLTTYDKVGVLLLGQKAVAKGISPGGDWIMIEYPGAPGGVAWVYAPYVNKSPGELKVVEPPPTATPQYTITIDPTMAAQFVVTTAPTRLATFTPPAPMAIPTYVDASIGSVRTSIPIGFVIIGLATVGIFVGLFSLTQGR